MKEKRNEKEMGKSYLKKSTLMKMIEREKRTKENKGSKPQQGKTQKKRGRK